MRRARWLLTLAVPLALAAALARATAPPPLALTACRLHGVSEEVKCGTLQVPENRAAPDGRKIGLRVAVGPALSGKHKPDPVFILAGGPGPAAAELGDLLLPQ